MKERIDLFNISIDNVTMAEAVALIRQWAREKKGTYVVTPNVDHVVKLQKDEEFLAIYRDAGLVIADGMPLIWVSRLVKKPLKERVTGADLFTQVCADAAAQGYSVYLLGSASQQIIETTAANLKSRYPGLKIAGAHSPSFGFEKNPAETDALIEAVRQAAPDVLFVGVGAPKQEKWIYRHRQRLNVPVALGVGASFDFVAGSVKRAPVWMQKTGLEWFYRFLSEPKRMFQRYFIDDFVYFRLSFAEWKKARRASKGARR
jgi:N-acetylglucosaminyldiphosphoundecaprenol N-acetyl-beta-D-mannosaminyltransferase